MKFLKNPILIFITFILSACGQQHVYSDYKPIPGLKWPSSDTIRFSFDIPDKKNYRFALSVRHRKNYEFSNFWLKARLKGPSLDTAFRYEMQLFNVEGRPFGECSGSTCTQTIPVKTISSLDKGHYELELVQLMRKDPLEGVQDIGLIIDK